MIALLALWSAHAATGEVTLGGELLPDSFGTSRARASLGLSVAESYRAWQVALSGTVRGAGDLDPVAELERAQLEGTVGHLYVGLGRQVKMDLRGNERLDGATVSSDGGTWSGALWGGRLWFPEALTVTDGTWVGGGEARVRLSQPVLRARVSGGLGAELRVTDGAFGGRVHAGAEARGVAGGGVRAVAEVDPAENRWRAQARVGAPLTRTLDIGATGRWEDLPAATIPDAAAPPSTWLSDAGYAVAAASLRVRDAGRSVAVEAGPVFSPGEDAGAAGRLDAAATAGATTGRVFGTGAWTGANGYVGGGLGIDQGAAHLGGGVEGGVYRVRHLDERDSWAGEARAHASGSIGAMERAGLALEVEVAGGADRLLSPWVRGGVLLTGRMDTRRERPAASPAPAPTPAGAS